MKKYKACQSHIFYHLVTHLVPANRACFKRSKKEPEASEAVPDAQVVKAPSKAELPTKQARKGRRAKAEVT